VISFSTVNDTPRSIPQLPSRDIASLQDICVTQVVREIHIDFLLEEEFTVNPSFLHHFMEAAGIHDGLVQVDRVQRSLADTFGEADLVVVYRRSEGEDERVAILIEDKIRAVFQPRQAERYHQRGKNGIGNDWNRYWTCLVAPESYVECVRGNDFDAVVTLEQIGSWIAASETKRHDFKKKVIDDAIQKAESTGVHQIDEGVTLFRECYYKCFEEVAMRPPAPTWKGDAWFRINSKHLRKGAYIHHKAPIGCVDLTFPDTDAILLKAAGLPLEDDMSVEQTGKSTAIRLLVNPIMHFENFEQQRANVEQALAVAKRLLSFYARERGRLDSSLSSARSAPAL
jgi:hypothetical protein